jgi:solute carrier family 39 (zinc transporter), member 1/2/3
MTAWTTPSLANTPAPVPAPVQAPQPSVELSTLLTRADSTCAAAGVDPDAYNTPLHVGALFIILGVSTLACAFPILATKFPGLRIPNRFFFAVRHFGTGVLIATAFVHLLPTAFISLGNPCLGDFWTKDYPAIPGAIALAAIFFVTIVEMVFHPSRHIPPAPAGQEASSGHGCMGSAAAMFPAREMGPLRGRATSIGQELTRIQTENTATNVAVNESSDDESHDEEEDNARTRRKETMDETTVEALQVHHLTPEQKQRKELLQCVLLELGILFHSIFIGMALSVSIGNEFIILLIAIVFHRKPPTPASLSDPTDIPQKPSKASPSAPASPPSSGPRARRSPGSWPSPTAAPPPSARPSASPRTRSTAPAPRSGSSSSAS